MKKRLLISSVLMSAVLACALGTGTYAWYGAASEGSVQADAITSNKIGTQTPNNTINGVEFVIALSGDDVTPSENEGVITYTLAPVALTDNSGASYYLTADNATPKAATYDSAKTSGSFLVTVSTEEDDAAVLAAYAGNYTVTVSANGWARVADSVETVWGEQSKDKADNGDYTVEFTLNISPSGEITGNTKTVYYSIAPSSRTTIEEQSAHDNDKITVSMA